MKIKDDDLHYVNGRSIVILEKKLSKGDLCKIALDVADALVRIYPDTPRSEFTPRFKQRLLEDGRYELEIF